MSIRTRRRSPFVRRRRKIVRVFIAHRLFLMEIASSDLRDTRFVIGEKTCSTFTAQRSENSMIERFFHGHIIFMYPLEIAVFLISCWNIIQSINLLTIACTYINVLLPLRLFLNRNIRTILLINLKQNVGISRM